MGISVVLNSFVFLIVVLLLIYSILTFFFLRYTMLNEKIKEKSNIGFSFYFEKLMWCIIIEEKTKAVLY